MVRGISIFVLLTAMWGFAFSSVLSAELLAQESRLTAKATGPTFHSKLVDPTVSGVAGPGEYFGHYVAIDGGRAAISARDQLASGAVTVFEFDGQDWLQSELLVPESGSSGAVALSGDWLLIGDPANSQRGRNAGAVYVFHYDGDGWRARGVLTGSVTGENDGFGVSIAMNGPRAVVGARRDYGRTHDTGTIHVFELIGNRWFERSRLWAEDGESGDNFGLSVDISGDRLAIGAYGVDSATLYNSGAVYTFTFDNFNWSQESRLPSPNLQAYSGFGVALDLDGDRLIVGAPYYDDDLNEQSGQAWVFDYDGDEWTETQALTAGTLNYLAEFGTSVSLGGDALVVGAPGSLAADLRTGATHLFRYDGSSWGEEKVIRSEPDLQYYSEFGKATAISGQNLLVGCPKCSYSETGRAFVYQIEPSAVV